jgi:hypothetical protein
MEAVGLMNFWVKEAISIHGGSDCMVGVVFKAGLKED